MSIFGIIVTFTVVWWMIFFAALPFGVRGQLETGEKIPRGAEAAAPSDPKLKIKALITTGIAVVVTVILWVAVTFHLLDSLGQ